MSKTKRVRIAVAIDADGNWNSFGYGGKTAKQSDTYLVRMALECLESAGPKAVHFIEADLPLPASVTVEGKVVE